MSKNLLIFRGCAGSGKSSAVKDLCFEANENGLSVAVASADDYFIQVVDDGTGNLKSTYVYDANKIGDAHRTCRRRAESAMQSGVDLVIIDNTNTTFKEMSPYAALAVQYGYNVEFREPQTPWWHRVKPLLHGDKREKEVRPHCKVFAEKNTHGVPEHAILRMLMRWECNPTMEKMLEQCNK